MFLSLITLGRVRLSILPFDLNPILFRSLRSQPGLELVSTVRIPEVVIKNQYNFLNSHKTISFSNISQIICKASKLIVTNVQ